MKKTFSILAFIALFLTSCSESAEDYGMLCLQNKNRNFMIFHLRRLTGDKPREEFTVNMKSGDIYTQKVHIGRYSCMFNDSTDNNIAINLSDVMPFDTTFIIFK